MYLNAAECQGEKEAIRSFHSALEAGKIRVQLFTEAREHALKGEDMPIDGKKAYICPICGITHVGEHKNPCPVCKAKSSLCVGF